MDEFDAVIVDNAIEIKTNTYWSCKADGNFKLSSYDGSGDTTINIIIPDDVITATGSIYFSFGDGKCKYPDLFVYITNNCYIETTPSYTMCDGKKTIYFFFKNPLEAFNVSVFSQNGWSINDVNNVKYITNNNSVFIIAQEDDGELSIVPQNCNENDIIYVKLLKNE